MAAQDPDRIVLCKRLIGYSEADLRAINIKDNTHAGEWDLDLLADWTADLTTDLLNMEITPAMKAQMQSLGLLDCDWTYADWINVCAGSAPW